MLNVVTCFSIRDRPIASDNHTFFVFVEVLYAKMMLIALDSFQAAEFTAADMS
jgi:hypothetical protein